MPLMNVTNARISGIVLAHKCVHEVVRTVERLLALPEKPPVIVADNDSQDSTVVEVAAPFPRSVWLSAVATWERLGAIAQPCSRRPSTSLSATTIRIGKRARFERYVCSIQHRMLLCCRVRCS
jgi:hypothetical protein